MKKILISIVVLIMGCSQVNKLMNPEIFICVTNLTTNEDVIVYDCYTDISESDCTDYASTDNYSFQLFTNEQTCEEFCDTIAEDNCTQMD